MEVYERLLAKDKNIVFRPSGDANERVEQLDRVVDLVFMLAKKNGFKMFGRKIRSKYHTLKTIRWILLAL